MIETTLSKEQIENIEKSGSSHVNGTLLQAVSARDFKKICDMALKYLEMKDAAFAQGRGGKFNIFGLINDLNLVPGPRPYDPKDKGTWPERNDVYVAGLEGGGWQKLMWFDGFWRLEGADCALAESRQKEIIWYLDVTKIPAIPEEKE